MEQLLQFIQSYDLNGLLEYWGYLERRLFSRLEDVYRPTVNKLKTSLFRYYLVCTVQVGIFHFLHMTEQLRYDCCNKVTSHWPRLHILICDIIVQQSKEMSSAHQGFLEGVQGVEALFPWSHEKRTATFQSHARPLCQAPDLD